MKHDPVLLHEVLSLAAVKPGNRILDCTLGLAGHARAFLEATGSQGTLVGLDADRRNLIEAKERLAAFKNCQFIHANFSTLPSSLPEETRRFDVIFADLGLSSPHVDDASRGFSFRFDAPLDMRYDRERGLMAAHYLQSVDQKTLLSILQSYGELPRPHAVVRAVVQRRTEHKLSRTSDLLEVARAVYRHDAHRYAPQIFQAVRIAVNDELGALRHFLTVLPSLAAEGARVLVMSYHSLEDRLVKEEFRALSTPAKDPVTGAETAPAEWTLLTRRPIIPTDREVKANPRSRSAKLRAVLRTIV